MVSFLLSNERKPDGISVGPIAFCYIKNSKKYTFSLIRANLNHLPILRKGP